MADTEILAGVLIGVTCPDDLVTLKYEALDKENVTKVYEILLTRKEIKRINEEIKKRS